MTVKYTLCYFSKSYYLNHQIGGFRWQKVETKEVRKKRKNRKKALKKKEKQKKIKALKIPELS